MKLKKSLLALACNLCLSCPVFAELIATPLPGDSRLVQFEYDSDQTYLILSRPKAVTHVEFAADEKIQTVAGGDTKHWELTPTANRRHLFIKPTYDGMETSMTVLTDKRSYQFVLRSTGTGAKWYQRVTWRHGNMMLMDSLPSLAPKLDEASIDRPPRQEQFSPENLGFGYRITGEAEFKPTSVFEDGRFTWIKLPAGLQEMPALFAVQDGDEYQLVNYVVKGDFVVAQRVIKAGVLKLGKSEVRFVQEQESNDRRTGFWK